jgi:hypothetical protein
MRVAVLALCAGLGACAMMDKLSWPKLGGGGESMSVFATSTLTPADPATNLIAGGPLTMQLASPSQPPTAGEDPIVVLTLSRADGRSLSFEAAEHTPADLAAQAPGGPLAEAMGLYGEEAPKLYRARPAPTGGGAPFLCPPEGPTGLGMYAAADGSMMLAGLRASFQFEPRADGGLDPAPVSPNIVCARMRFTH